MPTWMRDEFENALADWCSDSGINFLLGDGVDNNTTVGLDNVNLIKYGGQSSSLNGAMVINSVYYFPPCTGGEFGYAFSEIDFLVYSNFGNPDRANFRETILHELGHAHMLAHARSGSTSFEYLMHPYANPGYITTSDSEGANLVFSNSQSIVPGCTQGSSIPIGNGLCGVNCNPNPVLEISKTNQVKIAPIPSQDYVTLSFEESFKGLLSITLFDINGKNIFQDKVKGKHYNLLLPEEKGVYLIRVIGEKFSFTQKVIKL